MYELREIYLIFYNLFQFVGWCAILATGRLDLLIIFQTIQLLEVLHCLVGFVKSSVFQTFMQILSRIIIVWVALVPYHETQDLLGTKMIFYAWPVAESTRYLYYSSNLMHLNIYFLAWARYTFFIVLYPLGVSGELLILLRLLQIFKKTGDYSLALPNAYNMSFHAEYAVIGLMLSYVPFFPKLYMYMLSQRKKFFGSSNNQKIQSTRQKSD